MVSITMSTTSAFISSPTTLKLRKKSNTNKRSNNSLLKIAKAISVADVTGPVKETIKDVQSVEVQNTMRFSFSRGRIRIIIAREFVMMVFLSRLREQSSKNAKKKEQSASPPPFHRHRSREREREKTRGVLLWLSIINNQFNSILKILLFFCLVSFFLYPFFLKDNTNRREN